MEEINWLMQEQELSSNCTKTEDPPADQTLKEKKKTEEQTPDETSEGTKIKDPPSD